MFNVLLKVSYIFPHKGTLLKKAYIGNIGHGSEFKNEEKTPMPRKNNLKGPGPGRPKGRKNKISRNVAHCLEEAFNSPEIGGVNGLVEWGRKEKNKTDFFKLWSKLLPRNPMVNVGIGSPLKIDLSERLDAARKRIDRIRLEPGVIDKKQ